MNSRSFRLLIAIFILGGVFLYLTMSDWEPYLREWFGSFRHVSEVTPPLVPGTSGHIFLVKRVQVLRGDQFDLVLENENRIMAKLSVKAVEQAKSKVIDLLNNCENPKIRLLQKMPDGQWLVEFKVTQNTKEIDLATWLSDSKLVYQ